MNDPSHQQSKHLYGFGPFRLDTGERVLLRDGQAIPLTPKVLEVLIALVENAGHITEKDALLERVWPGTFVEESALAKNVFLLRRALGGEEDRYVETVPKRGYRFVAEVRRWEPATGPAAQGSPAAVPVAGAEQRPSAGAMRGRRSLWPVALGATLFVLLALPAYQAWRNSSSVTAPGSRRLTLAVLPFQNTGNDPEQEFLAEGLTGEMIARLSSLSPQSFAVIARTSTARYIGGEKDVAAAIRELGPDYVLAASVHRDGNQVRINAGLVRSSDQSRVWAETYERELGQILPLQRELAVTIARQIRVVLPERQAAGSTYAAPRVADAGPLDLDAHLLYLKGRYYWNKRTPAAIKGSADLYRQALDREPNYAAAWAGLAMSYALFDEYNILPARQSSPLAKAAASRALELDPLQVEARAALAAVRSLYEWDWAAAEQDFQQAIALNPNYSVARHWYGFFLMARGRPEEARLQFEHALANDPLSNSIPVAIGASYYHAREFDQAIAQYLRVIEIQPRSAGVRFHLGRAYVQKKMLKEAIEQFEEGTRLAAGHDGDASLAYGYAVAGRRAEALKVLSQIPPGNASYSPYYVAAVHVALGDKARALEQLERAYQQRLGRLTFLAVEPMFDPIRSDPRFQELCRRIGFAPAANLSANR